MKVAQVVAAILRLTGVQPDTVDAVRFELVAPTIVEESEAFGFDPLLVTALIYAESRFDPNAKNAKTGAVGYLQLLRGGAVPGALAEMSDAALSRPRRNLAIGLSYLSQLREKCSRGPVAYLSLWGGFGSCRPSDFSRSVVATWKALRKVADGTTNGHAAIAERGP